MSENPIATLQGDISLIRSWSLDEVLKQPGGPTEEETQFIRLLELYEERSSKVDEAEARKMNHTLLERCARVMPRVKARLDAIPGGPD